MRTENFEYELPPELIAQEPTPERTAARMMVVDRQAGVLTHSYVRDLPQRMSAGDLIVVNNTRVIPARLFGHKANSGGRVELLLLEEREAGIWDALCRTSRRPIPGTSIVLAEGRLRAEVLRVGGKGQVQVQLHADGDLYAILDASGFTPLPPYIRRDASAAERLGQPDPVFAQEHQDLRARDRERYQTVYAEVPGAVAAPTAGLHLSAELLETLAQNGVPRVAVTLHVGLGTFRSVATEEVSQHAMEAERYDVSIEAATQINAVRIRGGRILAVGTTSARTLETVADTEGHVHAGSGRSDLFIWPPYHFRAVDMLLTNFHLPRSTLLMLVSALAGLDLIREAYAEAVRLRYRFYSYGDCMLIV